MVFDSVARVCLDDNKITLFVHGQKPGRSLCASLRCVTITVIIIGTMSLLEQTRAAMAHVPGLGTNPPSQLLPPHPLDNAPPNPDVLLALLARNKALEGR